MFQRTDSVFTNQSLSLLTIISFSDWSISTCVYRKGKVVQWSLSVVAFLLTQAGSHFLGSVFPQLTDGEHWMDSLSPVVYIKLFLQMFVTCIRNKLNQFIPLYKFLLGANGKMKWDVSVFLGEKI